MSKLYRFINAQDKDYKIALSEIKNGQKKSDWMWYIFPQIKGIGFTPKSKFYGIKNIEEAIDYLNNDILRKNLIEISQALLDLGSVEIREVMGFPDDLNLKSSMTLFKEAEGQSKVKCDNIFQKVLDQFFNGEDDPKTLVILQKQENAKEEGIEEKEDEEEIDVKEFERDILKNLDEHKKKLENEKNKNDQKDTSTEEILTPDSTRNTLNNNYSNYETNKVDPLNNQKNKVKSDEEKDKKKIKALSNIEQENKCCTMCAII